MTRAVLYCRVSTKDQAENFSLPTQERACREYCDRAGIEVAEVFVDRGESAKTADRPAFQRALEFCRRGGVSFFVVYNLSRFARSTHDHAIVGARLKAHGVTLRSVTEPIDDSSTGRLMESILSGFAQFDNDVRAERTKAGMRAALEKGRWTHRAPLGYLKGMGLDPDRAPIIREAFALAASWQGPASELCAEVGRRLGLTTRTGRPVPRMTFWRMLRAPIYAGILRAPGIEARGDFTPIVDEETFYRAQAAMSGRAKLPRRKLNPEFPLRRLVRCGACAHALTGYFAQGKAKRYAYYRCAACDAVSVPKAIMEAAFVDLLDSVGFDLGLLAQLRTLVLEEWGRGAAEAVAGRERQERALAALRLKKSRLLDGYLTGDVAAPAYREKLAEIEDAIALAAAASVGAVVEESELQGALDFAAVCLSRPGRAWLEFPPEGQREFAGLVFPEGLAWEPGAGLRTPTIAPIFGAFARSEAPKIRMVAPTGQPANTGQALVFLWKASLGQPPARSVAI